MRSWSWSSLLAAVALSGTGILYADESMDEMTAPPPQFPLVESQEYTHGTWYKFWTFSYQPADWTQPHDFSRGNTYFRFEITDLSQEAMLQFCYFQDRHVSEKHACSPQWRFTEPGVYYQRQDNRQLWQRQVIDWTRPLLDFMLIDNLTEGAARTRVRVSMFVVAAGHPFRAPSDWECPSDWDCAGVGDPNPGAGGTSSGGDSGAGGSASGGAASGGSASGGTASGGTASGGAASGGAASGGSNTGGGGTTSGGGGAPSLGGAAGGPSGAVDPPPEPSATGGRPGRPPPPVGAPAEGQAERESGGCSVARPGVRRPGLNGFWAALGLLMAAVVRWRRSAT